MRLQTLAWGILAALAATASADAQPAAVQPPTHARPAEYGRLPLTFEMNQGQTGSEVKFLSRGSGYTAFLTTGGMVLSLRPSAVVTAPGSVVLRAGGNATVQFTLVGATQSPTVVGEDPQPGRVNYFFGNDPTKWHTDVPTYGRVRYKNVYPGIDLLYYGNRRQLEYNFEVQPGSDPRRIQFEIRGARQIELDPEGNLVLRLGNGEIHFQSPIVYQQSNGQRTPVGGAYVMTDPTHVAFQVAHYDSNQPLVVDREASISLRMPSQRQLAEQVVEQNERTGRSGITGMTEPPAPYNLSLRSSLQHPDVTRPPAVSPVLVYSTYLGGSGTDQAAGIAVDSAGSVYVAGYTNSVDFPLATLGALPKNKNHVFVAKLDPAGANLIYADYIAGNGDDYGVGLVLDGANEVYVTGSTASSNFPVVKAYQSQQPGPYAGFLTKVSADGSSLLYSTYLGGSTSDQPTGIAIDGFGQVHIAGYTASQNFPVANAYQGTASANQAGIYGDYGFLTKFSADGSSLVYSTYLAGNSNVAQQCWSGSCWPAPYTGVSAIALDANGEAYLAGTTNTYNFPVTSGAFLAANQTQQDAEIGFVSKFTSAGGLDYSTYFYPSSGAALGITAIAVDSTGSAYIAGHAQSDGTFPITSTHICDPGVYGKECGCAFITKFDPTASTLLYSTFLAPNTKAVPRAIALDAKGDAYVLASASSPSLQTSNAIAQANAAQVLLVEVDPGATTQLFSSYLGPRGRYVSSGMVLDADGNIYVTGSAAFSGSGNAQGTFANRLGSASTFVVKMGRAPKPDISVAGVALSPESLTFSSTQVGVTSAVQTVTLTNQDSSDLDIWNIQTTGDYAQTNDCPDTLASRASCSFNITFTPTASGTRNGTLTISDSAMGSPQSVSLTGTGVDFSLAASPTSATINAGATATYTVTVASVGGSFTNPVNLTCTGVPNNSNCQLSSASVTPGSASATVTVTVTTIGSSAQFRSSRGPVPLWITLQGLGVFGLVVAGSKPWKNKALAPIATLVLLAALLFLSGCAGGTGIGHTSGTNPGTYQITVTGTSGALQHSLPLTLTVQ